MSLSTLVPLVLLTSCTLVAQPRDTLYLTLDEVIIHARTHNLVSRLADAERDEAHAASRRAFALPAPVVSAEYDFIPLGASPSSYGERSISIEQTIPSPLAWYHTTRESAALRAQADAERRDVVRRFLADVRHTYWRLAASRARSTIAIQQHQRAQRLMDAARRRAEAGQSARADLFAARTMLAQADIERERREVDVLREAIALATLIGHGDDTPQRVYLTADSLTIDTRFMIEQGMVLGAAMESSDAVRAARRAVEAASAAAAASSARLFPALSLGLLSQRERGAASSYGLRIGAAVPLWYLLDQRHDQQVQQARASQAETRLRLTEQRLGATIRTLLAEQQVRRREATRYVGEMLPDANALVDMTERAWIAGEVSFLDVIQARNHHARLADEAVAAMLAYRDIITDIQSLLSTEDL